MIGMQDKKEIQGLVDNWSNLIFLIRVRKHHMQKITAVGKIRIGVVDRFTGSHSVGKSGNGANF